MEKYLTLTNLVIGICTIIGFAYAFYRWGWGFIKDRYSGNKGVTFSIPKKTIVIAPTSNKRKFWWHMGSVSGDPAMQIVGRCEVTNITKYNISLSAVKMKKPRHMGMIMVKDTESQYHGRYPIPSGALTNVSFDFWVVPPFKEKGKSFCADIAILDQFGNEHWIKKVEFVYS